MTGLTEAGIYALAETAFLANGMSADQAASIAGIVTRAEVDACRSHGLYRVSGYVAALRAGRANPLAVPRLTRTAPAVLRCDGDRGFAPFAFAHAREALIGAARSQGIATLAVQNSHHFSALWAEIEPLTAAGLVACAFVIGQCAVAPHGGTKRLFGTNPMAFGWPRPGREPMIFDFATSAAARGEVELCRLAGEDLPEGWGIDPAGQPSTDPTSVLQGALLPFGGLKARPCR